MNLAVDYYISFTRILLRSALQVDAICIYIMKLPLGHKMATSPNLVYKRALKRVKLRHLQPLII